MGATHGKAPVGFAPIAIGFNLTLVHLVGIPITNTSVNHGSQHQIAVNPSGTSLFIATADLLAKQRVAVGSWSAYPQRPVGQTQPRCHSCSVPQAVMRGSF